MAGKPPAAGPAKASFKHNLPTNLGATYFTSLHQFVQKDVPDYNTEHEKVCHDILRACQMASNGFSPEANLGPATASLATGKTLYSPQRDQYNGPLQAFLQHPLSAFGRPSIWQHWVKCRDQLVDDFSLYAKRCFRAEVKVIDPPTETDGSPLRKKQSFHGGNLNRTASSAGGFGNSQLGMSGMMGGSRMGGSFAASPGGGGNMSFARMPGDQSPGPKSPSNNSMTPTPGSPKGLVRPGTAQAPSRETSTTDVFIRCGTNSFFDPERLVLVHVWANPRAARTFVQLWRRLAQITFEHRLDMIHCPISVVNCIDSSFVSVTALPPVLDPEKAPPLRNMGTTESGFESLIDRMSHQLLEVLTSDATDTAASKGGLTLYPAVDGRYYLMNLHTSLHPKFAESKLGTCFPRPELLTLRVSEKLCDQPLDKVITDHALPRALKTLRDMMDDPAFTVDIVIRDGLCGMTFHQHGVNMKYLGLALEMVDAGKLPPSLSKDPKKSAAALRSVIVTEMVGRTLKYLIRLDCHLGAAGGRDRDLTKTCGNQKARLDVVNRIARLVVGRNQEFMENQVLPILRNKFNIPAFETSWQEVNPGTCLKILSSKFGCEFGPTEGRFHRFVPASSKDLVMLACNAPLEAVLCEDKPGADAATNIFWNQCLALPSDSTLYESYLIRACSTSVITQCQLDKIPKQLVDGSSVAEANAMSPVFLLQLSGALFEHLCKEAKSTKAATVFLSALRDHMVEVDSRRENSASITPEATYNSLKHIQIAPMIEKFSGKKDSVDPTYLESGIKFFVDQPHIDFVYSAQHAQALRDVEAMIPMMTPEQLDHFLSETVESVVDALQKYSRLSNAARYAQRVVVQLVGVPTAEKSSAAAKTMRLCYSLSVKAYGIEDPRTSVALYLQCLFALTVATTPQSPTTIAATASQCRKLYEKAMTLQPSDQKAFYKTTTVYQVLSRTLTAFDNIGDIVTATSLKSHIKLLQSLHGPVILMQMVGRGYITRRQHKGRFANIPQPPPKLPSLGITPGVSASSPGGSNPLGQSTNGSGGGPLSPMGQRGPSGPGNMSFSSSFAYMPGGPNALKSPSQGPATPNAGGGMNASLSGSSTGGNTPQGGMQSRSSSNLGFVMPSAPPPLPPALTSPKNGQPPLPPKSPNHGTSQPPPLPPGPPPPPKNDSEVLVESLDDDDDEDYNAKPQASQFTRKPTFSRPGGLQRKGTGGFGMQQVNNSEFGAGSQQGSSNFSSPKSLPRRRLNLSSDGSPSPQRENSYGNTATNSDSDDDDDDENQTESMFKLCDKDGDGLVSVDDCVSVFSTFGVMSTSELRTLFSAAAKSAKAGGGKMNIKEFAVVVAKTGI